MEKRYYTKSKEELEEIRAELQAEREAMTEEEWLAEQLENERGFQRLMERLECEQKKYKRIRNPEKEEAFKKMCEVFYPIDNNQTKKAVTMNTEMLKELFRAYKQDDLGNFSGVAYRAFQAISDFESHKTSQRSTDRENERGLVMAVNGMPILTQALEYIMDQTGVKL